MPASPAALRFPSSRVLLPRTRLAYIHIRNLLTDAKRDRAARISGYVAISLLDELITLYLLRGEVANATIRDSRGARPVAIATALERIPAEPEYGEITFCEASEEQLGCMFDTHAKAPEPWPESMATQEPAVLFPYLMSTTFDGFIEIIAKDQVNYLVFAHGSVARAYLSSAHHGTVVDRVAKLFSREARISDLRLSRWSVPGPLPVQAPTALVQAYRELSGALVKRLVELGRENAPTLAEETRLKLVEAHPSLEGFSFNGTATKAPLSETSALTTGVAAWIRDVIWAASDDESIVPDKLLRELTWDRRHMFQSAGLFDQVPWKVM
jgi:hypothetical protein